VGGSGFASAEWRRGNPAKIFFLNLEKKIARALKNELEKILRGLPAQKFLGAEPSSGSVSTDL
jgi:hypothetical protein